MNYEERSEPNLDRPFLTYNQEAPNDLHINNLKTALKSDTQLVACPYCRYQDFTNIEVDCSTINVFFCLVTLGIVWCPYQYCRNKDFNCYNTTHWCKRCGQVLSDYKAC